MVPVSQAAVESNRYAKTIEVSKRIRWDTDRDVIRGREFDFTKKFLPDGLSKVGRLAFLSDAEKRFFSQVQGRTYANMFALVERFIGAKMTALGGAHALGDQVAFEALVRLTDEELKHQEMFRRLEAMTASGMPAGYRFLPEPNDVAVHQDGSTLLLSSRGCYNRIRSRISSPKGGSLLPELWPQPMGPAARYRALKDSSPPRNEPALAGGERALRSVCFRAE